MFCHVKYVQFRAPMRQIKQQYWCDLNNSKVKRMLKFSSNVVVHKLIKAFFLKADTF